MLHIAMLMLVQDIGPPDDDPSVRQRFPTRQRRCQPNADADIVVCGRGVDSQRVERLPEWPSEPVFRPASARLSPNKTVTAHAEEGQNPFSSSPRAMISFKLDF